MAADKGTGAGLVPILFSYVFNKTETAISIVSVPFLLFEEIASRFDPTLLYPTLIQNKKRKKQFGPTFLSFPVLLS